MADAKCRFCDHAADAGAYCGSWTEAIMAKALNLFLGGKRKKGQAGATPERPPLNGACSGDEGTCGRSAGGKRRT